MSIRDTSQQDTPIAALPFWRQSRWLWRILAALLLIIAAVYALLLWMGSSQSVSMSRLSMATVAKGTLVRDAAVNGRLVAANSPSLYSSTASTVSFLVKAGDKVKKGDVVAELDSPDLVSELKREQALLEQLEAEIARQKILARKQKCWQSVMPSKLKLNVYQPNAHTNA
jgi:HlyD family secretion protein